MSRSYIFADEAGCLTFERKPNVSRYFILCTIMTTDCSAAQSLIDLRRQLAWDGAPLGEYFHATTDKQIVRDEVFKTISRHDFTIQATIMEKTKAFSHIRESQNKFYKYGWFYHFKYGVNTKLSSDIEALVTAAAIGTRKEQATFQKCVDDVLSQFLPAGKWKTDFPPAHADPCVQVADYCAWAIQRKWERGDDRSFKLIQDRINYSYDLWARGSVHHY